MCHFLWVFQRFTHTETCSTASPEKWKYHHFNTESSSFFGFCTSLLLQAKQSTATLLCHTPVINLPSILILYYKSIKGFLEISLHSFILFVVATSPCFKKLFNSYLGNVPFTNSFQYKIQGKSGFKFLWNLLKPKHILLPIISFDYLDSDLTLINKN